MASIPRPRVGVVTSFSRNVDYELLAKVADSFPNSLVLVGSKTTDLEVKTGARLKR